MDEAAPEVLLDRLGVLLVVLRWGEKEILEGLASGFVVGHGCGSVVCVFCHV